MRWRPRRVFTILWGIALNPKNELANLHASLGVHRQNFNGCIYYFLFSRRSTNVRQAKYSTGFVPLEVIFPRVISRMKQARQIASVRIDAGKVGPFLPIAQMACESKVLRLTTSPMLPSYDVLYVEDRVQIVDLANAAVFTAVSRSVPNELFCFFANHL